MNNRITRLLIAIFVCNVALGSQLAFSQPGGLGDIAQQNMMFDQQFNQQLGSMMQQNQMAQQQLLQSYIQQNGPQLQRDYQQYVQTTGMQIPFEQFAYSHMATQGGRNPGPALQQQQNNFRALQDAHNTVQQGFDSQNQGWWANQQRQDNVYQRYDDGAIRGNAYYQNPNTGETYQMPYGGQPGVYGNNQDTFINDQQGNYHQVDPQGYTQQLNQVDPYANQGGGAYPDDE